MAVWLLEKVWAGSCRFRQRGFETEDETAGGGLCADMRGEWVYSAGCCWVRQCNEPKPRTRSTAWIPTTVRSLNKSPRIPKATRSCGSLKVGTITAALEM